MECQECDGYGFVMAHEEFKVWEQGALVSDFKYFKAPCECEYGPGWAKRNKVCEERSGAALQEFIDAKFNLEASSMSKTRRRDYLRELTNRFNSGERLCGLGLSDRLEQWWSKKKKEVV